MRWLRAQIQSVATVQPSANRTSPIRLDGATRPDTHTKSSTPSIYPLDGDELMAWVAGRVAPYKRIREVQFVEAVPRTPSGKLLRRVLIEQEQQMA